MSPEAVVALGRDAFPAVRAGAGEARALGDRFLQTYRNLSGTLGGSLDIAFEGLATADQSDVIALADKDVQISLSGVHVGVRIGDRIFDNFHPDGVSADEWANRFMTATGASLVQEAAPVKAFRGRIFMRKRFLNWLFGARER